LVESHDGNDHGRLVEIDVAAEQVGAFVD